MTRRKLDTLKRLVALYGVIEEMHSAEVQRITAAVRQAQHAIGVQGEIERSAGLDGRGALITGDRMAWTLSETQREIASAERRRWQQVCVAREEFSKGVTAQYAASRLKSGQMKQLVEVADGQLEIEEKRRMQAHSDDRFLARRRWTDARDELRADSEINNA